LSKYPVHAAVRSTADRSLAATIDLLTGQLILALLLNIIPLPLRVAYAASAQP
jgi:hypothetical protein